jgi:hypothetical protein
VPLACAAVALSSCGADDAKQAIDPVAEAAATTQQAGNARVAMRGTISEGSERVTIDGHGVVSGKGDRARVTVRLGLGGKSVEMEQIVDGTVIYMGGELMRRLAPGDETWAKVDLGEVAADQGIDLNRFDGGTSDFTRLLEFLKSAGDVRKVGRERVNGVATTRYRARIEFAKLVEDADDPATKRSVERLERLSGTRVIPVDVWIDDRTRVRRQRVRFGLGPQGRVGTGEMVTDFVAFGVPLDADPPDEGDVLDVTDIATQGAPQGP